MKTLKFLAFSLLIGFGFSNCSDPCKDVICENGNCDEGTCICTLGWEGTNCDTEVRTKYYGVFEGEFTPCIPDLLLDQLGGQIDLTLFSQFLTGTMVVGPGSSIEKMTINASSPFVSFNQEIDISSSSFPITETTTTIDDPNLLPIAITITGQGFGVFTDTNTITLTLTLSLSIDLFPFPIPTNCEVILIKQ